MSETRDNSGLWIRRARALAFRVNVAAWLARFLPVFALSSVAATAAVLFARSFAGNWKVILLAWGASIALVGLLFFLKVRHARWSIADALVRLESVNQLNSQLSASAAGATRWPQSSLPSNTGFRWHWGRVGLPALLGVAALSAGIFVPILEHVQNGAGPVEAPMSVQQVEKWVEELKKGELTDPKTLEQVERMLEELKNRPSQDWYSHASLEAGANLKAQVEQSLRSMSEQMTDARRALDGMQAAGAKGLSTQVSEQSLREAVAAMEANGLKPNEAMMQQLKQLAQQGAMRQLDPSQLQQAAKQLQQGIAGANKILGQRGEKLGEGPGVSPGSDEVNRGPGEAPMFDGREAPPTPGQLQPLDGLDPSRVAIGDKISEELAAPSADPTQMGGGNAGGTATAGEGGDRTWHERFLPQEQEVLKRYFK